MGNVENACHIGMIHLIRPTHSQGYVTLDITSQSIFIRQKNIFIRLPYLSQSYENIILF